MKVLVTGGAGYIGSTICTALIENGHTPIILDSLVNGRVEFTEGKIFYHGDISDIELLDKIFIEHNDIYAVIHCAALIVVPDSVANPFEYYNENVVKSMIMYKKLFDLGCKRIIFSSSASIYDDVEGFMVKETSPLNPRSPYARTKYMMEMILEDFCNAYEISAIALRYFNPIGADPKMRSGAYIENPSHVLGKLVSVASGENEKFYITGVNWNTRDGSGIRDYLHVWDLAIAHVKAVESFESAFVKSNLINKYMVINLGTGNGVTVKELVAAFENVYGKVINKTETDPRPGDVPGSYANCDKALKLIGWQAKYSIEKGIEDALKWEDIRRSKLKY